MKQIFTCMLLGMVLCFNPQLFAQTADDLSDKNYGKVTISNAQGQHAFPNQNSIYRTTIPAPVATGDNLCAPGTANLSATAASGGTLSWFNVATGGTAIANGASYAPAVTGTTNYWVEETVAGAGGGASSMATPYNSNNGQRGCMFDITATNAITITNFDANLYAGTTANYEIYYRAGTHVGFENNAAAWTLLGSTTGLTSLGSNVPTPLPINFSVAIPAGQTYSFYITNDFGAGVSYTDGTAVGNFLASDANLTLYEGVGKSYPFGLTFNVRNFNGTVHYTTGSGPCTSPRTLVTANVKTPSYAPTAITTSSNASCTVNEGGVDWTYYYNTANPNDLLFAIAHDPMNLGNNTFTAAVDVTVNANSSTTGYYAVSDVGNQLARFVMGRYWNVNLTSGAIIDPVWIRYYYQPAEKAAINTAATAWQGTNGGVQSPLYFFKTVGTTFDPITSLHANGVYNGIELSNYIDNQTTSNGTNYVEIHDINSFSGGGLISGVVPVGGTTSGNAILLNTELLTFSVERAQENAQINWSVVEDQNVSHYIIERSSDAITFNPMGRVDAESGSKISNYGWADLKPLVGVNYYRLKIVLLDGTNTYSTVKAVTFKDSDGVDIAVMPIPFDNVLMVRAELDRAQQISVKLVNTLGQVVHTTYWNGEKGLNRLEVENLNTLTQGCYVIVLEGDAFSKQLSIVKK